jgi:hypothetical protein
VEEVWRRCGGGVEECGGGVKERTGGEGGGRLEGATCRFAEEDADAATHVSDEGVPVRGDGRRWEDERRGGDARGGGEERKMYGLPMTSNEPRKRWSCWTTSIEYFQVRRCTRESICSHGGANTERE